MSKIIKERVFGKMEGDFVVFLIGMRINNFFKVHRWLPVFMAMPKMIKELHSNPGSGFLGAHTWFGRTTVMLQYWRSFEHLEAYAKDKDGEHYPAWKKFNMKLRSTKAAGIWHETYKVTEGTYENVYVNMPLFGLARAGRMLTASEKYDSARARMENKTN